MNELCSLLTLSGMWNEEYCKPKFVVTSLVVFPKHEVKANGVQYTCLDEETNYAEY